MSKFKIITGVASVTGFVSCRLGLFGTGELKLDDNEKFRYGNIGKDNYLLTTKVSWIEDDIHLRGTCMGNRERYFRPVKVYHNGREIDD